MKVIGIVGGMGSGKSYLCKKSQDKLGIPVFYFDIEAKKVLCRDEFIIKEMKKMFGENIYFKNGNIDSKKLADIIFTNDKDRLEVETLIRGILLDKFYKFIYLTKKHLKPPYIMAESATMTQTGLYKIMDEVIFVDAAFDKRIEKLINERNVEKKDALRRINLQEGINAQKKAFHDKKIPFTIFNNDFTEKTVEKFVNEFHNNKMCYVETEK